MSLGKLPGIKGLVSGSQGKRRFKSELCVDMISPPMGDFRHTMHVGRGGEVFGDTSFLSNYGGPHVSPIIKNAISLPQLNMDSSNGCLQRVQFPSSVSSTDDSLCSTYGLQSGFVTLPRLSRLDRPFQDGDARRGSLPDGGGFTLTRSDSLASFTVDLGPSLMSEVLSWIDNPSCFQMSNYSQEADEEKKKKKRTKAL
ncbi:hypothetical protein F7725_003835 [Dissostichus mawsoni]|uniref:CRIB domain-containing protein n=1 Tax=Dissostichus mawsoni TaxID=36200 RepID=A0A7J5YDZ0_DISMA|nr:hypothetical protein F7725_003835 [Dissostichus mawsoni]